MTIIELVSSKDDPNPISIEADKELLAMIDRLVGTGFGSDRAEVIKNVIEHSLRRNESIGNCDLCGLLDHHLVEGACKKCRDHYNIINFPNDDRGYRVGDEHP